MLTFRSCRIKTWLVCLLLIGVCACSSNKKKELKPLQLESFEQSVELDTLWSRKVGSGFGEYYHQFILAMDDRFVYAAAENGNVYKFDKISGKKQWKISLGVKLTVGVSVDDERIYVGAIDGTLLALNKDTGMQVWSRQLASEIVSAASISADHVIVQAANGEIFDFNAANGEQRWRFGSAMPALTFRGNSRAAFFANYVVAGLANGKLAVIDIMTGQLVWEPKIADAKGDTEIERIVDVDASPLIIDEMLLAVSVQGRLVANDLKTGRIIWAEDESSFREIDADGDKVYVTNMDGVVTAYDLHDGTVKWANEDLLRRKVSGPRVVNKYIVAADFEGYVHVFSQADGQLVGRKRAAYEGIKSPALVDGSRFYIIANNGRLKAYQIGERNH